ncbi:type VII secretion-associated protein [Nocardia sp. NPDC051832]|uniref:type VII secretion-associated protein n=1 Tax=Nocardia sp. NPDC051832 TaxID=3155673 RepID=UPI00342D740A
MSQIELVVTDTRIWAVGPTTHWNVPPSVVLGSNGNLVVGEPLTPPTQVSSAVQFVPADRIALLPRVPSVVESLTNVVGTIFDNLGVAVPCDQVTVVCPTEWGSARRGMLDDAVRRFARDVVFEDMAFRAVSADEGTARSRRTVVVEFGMVSTTATTVVRSHQGVHIESTEFEPELTLAGNGVEPGALDRLGELLSRLLDGRPVDVVQILGVSDPAKLDLIRSVAQQTCGPEVDLRPISGVDLVRGPQQVEPERRPEPQAPPVMPSNEWMQPLRERAAAQQAPARRKTALIFGSAAAVLVLVVAAITAAVLMGGSDEDPGTVAASTSAVAATSAAPPPGPSGKPGPSDKPAPPGPEGQEKFGSITFVGPDLWTIKPSADGNKVELTPFDGTKQRLIVTQRKIAPNAGYQQIAADLENQMKTKPALSELKRDYVFGGRSGLGYTEKPSDGSTVRWFVLVEYGIQVNIGCQYPGDGWSQLQETCEKFAGSVHVVPQ